MLLKNSPVFKKKFYNTNHCTLKKLLDILSQKILISIVLMDFMNQWMLLWIVTRSKRSSVVFYLCKVTRSSGFWIEQKKRFNLDGKGYIHLKTDVKVQAFHLLELVFFLIGNTPIHC